MAYYAALVSVLELLKEINNPEHPYSVSLLEKHQIHVPLYEKFKLLQELLGDHSPKLDKEATDYLERRIRDAAYRTQDIIESQISDLIPKQLDDLEKVDTEVDSIVEELVRIKESPTTHEEDLQVESYISTKNGGGASQVETPSGINTMVGFEKHLTTIKDQLCGQSFRREVISIVGMGGLGKSTLARNVFDDKLVDYHFDCRAWITISQDYHLRKVLLGIATSLKIIDDELSSSPNEVLELHIYKHLKGRRYLIILDDMWNTNVWDDINRIFPDDSNGSRIMITTRLSDVAVYAGKSSLTHPLVFLNKDESWSLFSRKVFCPAEFEDIGRLIVENCRGLPLAIVVVAGLLSKVEKTRHYWEEIARSVNSSVIENDDNFSEILSLSYNHLPCHLKPCFLYLGGFPEDHEINVFRLILSWVAEGFIRPIESKSLEEVAEEYLQDLVSRNLVLVTEKKSNGKFKRCVIHDLLRDLCSQRAHHENFLFLQKNVVSVEVIRNARRLYIHPGFQLLDPRKEYVRHLSPIFRLRSILAFGDFWYYNIVWYMSQFKLLRVFDAFETGVRFFTHVEIEEMLYLRYLAVRHSILHIPPYICKLQNLHTLILNGEISLPVEIWNMPQLRHVMIRKMTFPPIPYGESWITDRVPLLGVLQTLSTLVNFKFTNDIVEMIPSLRKLKVIYNNEPYKAWQKFCLNNLVCLQELETLDIRFSMHRRSFVPFPESFAFPQNLQKLSLFGCRLPWKDMRVVGLLPKLQVLKLRHQAFLGEEWETIEGEFPMLKFLLMDMLYPLKYWQAENTHFPCLEHLTIRYCITLKEIPPEIGDIPTLQLIEIYQSKLVADSALKIQEEQRDLGNDVLKVRIHSNDDRHSSPSRGNHGHRGTGTVASIPQGGTTTYL